MALDYDEYVRAESARFLEALRDADPAARVPCCPDWSAADLAYHLGEVQARWGEVVRDRRQTPSKLRPSRPAGYRELLDSVERISAELSEALAGATDDEQVWTWFDDDRTVGFVRRRQAHEALIHRLDAEQTAGVEPTDVDPQLATDGVAEALETIFAYVPPWAEYTAGDPTNPSSTGTVVTTDTATRWVVQVGEWAGTSPRTGREFAAEPVVRVVDAGDTASWEVRGTARDLDAWLWSRPTLGQVERSGDTAAFEAVIRRGVQ